MDGKEIDTIREALEVMRTGKIMVPCSLFIDGKHTMVPKVANDRECTELAIAALAALSAIDAEPAPDDKSLQKVIDPSISFERCASTGVVLQPVQDDGKPESETTNRLLECSVCGDLEGAPYEQGDTCTMCGVGVYRTKPTPARDIPGEVWDMLVDHLPAKGRTKLYDKMRAYFGAVTGKEPVRGDVQP